MNQKPLIAECGECGERWKIATLPISCGSIPRKIQCPNCAERKSLYWLDTMGPHAVTEARQGKEVTP